MRPTRSSLLLTAPLPSGRSIRSLRGCDQRPVSYGNLPKAAGLNPPFTVHYWADFRRPNAGRLLEANLCGRWATENSHGWVDGGRSAFGDITGDS